MNNNFSKWGSLNTNKDASKILCKQITTKNKYKINKIIESTLVDLAQDFFICSTSKRVIGHLMHLLTNVIYI